MGVTCRADVSVITHMWTDRDSQPIVNQTAPHQCVDFSQVIDYSRKHTVDVFQDNYIVHPKFGKLKYNPLAGFHSPALCESFIFIPWNRIH